MNYFTKKQIKILAVLNTVTALLVIGLIFLPWVSPFYGDTSLDANTTVDDHNRYRSSRISADPSLEWENNLGGSGDETVVDSFITASGFIVFGNTNSTDYDFSVTSYSGFAIVFKDNGQAESYLNFDGNIEKVIAYNGDYLVCINNENESKILRVSSLGVTKSSLTLSLDANEKILDCYIDYFSSPDLEPFHAVTSYTNITFNQNELKVYVINSNFEVSYTRNFVRNSNLDYVAGYSHSTGFYMFANIEGYYTTSLTYYTWTKSNFDSDNRDNLNISMISSYICKGVIPVDVGRYAVLIISSDGYPYIIDCYNYFAYYDIIPLGNVIALNTFFASDSNYIYAHTYTAGDTSTVYKLNSELNIVDKLSNFSDSTKIYAHSVTPKGTLFCSKENEYQSIVGQSLDGENYVNRFYSKYEETCSMLYDGNNIILVGNSTSSSSTINGNYGGSDIFIIKVTL